MEKVLALGNEIVFFLLTYIFYQRDRMEEDLRLIRRQQRRLGTMKV